MSYEFTVTFALHDKCKLFEVTNELLSVLGISQHYLNNVETPQDYLELFSHFGRRKLVLPDSKTHLTRPHVHYFEEEDSKNVVRKPGAEELMYGTQFMAACKTHFDEECVQSLTRTFYNLAHSVKAHVCCLVIDENDKVIFASVGSDDKMISNSCSPTESKAIQDQYLGIKRAESLKQYCEKAAWEFRIF